MPEPLIEIRGYLIAADDLLAELRPQGYRLVADWQMRMATVEGYVSRYYENINLTTTYVLAWEKTEQEFQEVFQVKRFDSYDSFRNSSQVMRVINKR